MTAFDTNVLVRFLIRDDPHQHAEAENAIRALSDADPGWIGSVVLLETVWVLSSIYRLPRASVAQLLSSLLGVGNLVFEREAAIREAIGLYSRGKAGFADCLISATARAAGCSRTVTFDRVAARDAGMELLG